MRHFFLGLLCTSLTTLVGCSASRPLLPPGVVPNAELVSAEDEQYGHEVLSDLSEQFELSRNDVQINRVREVANRLTKAADANQDPWHVYIFHDDDFKNAAATRGNYIFVWSGMLNAVNDDDELATILAHEIGHVLAGHTKRDPSEEAREMVAGVAGSATSEILSATGSAGIIANLAEFIVKTSLKAILVNPELQAKELEADQIGLFLMADAGFDPEKGVAFWERVKSDPDFSGFPIQFMSSHPSTEARYERLQGILSLAMDRYRGEKSQRADSFVVNGNNNFDKSTTFSNAPRDRLLNETWIVVEDHTDLLESNSIIAKKIESLKAGTQVRVRRIVGDWLEISTPKFGFVRSVDLAPFQPYGSKNAFTVQ